MEAAVSSSLGAMCPLLKKLDLLLAPQYRLRYRVKKGIRLLKEDVQEVSSALMELTMLETPSLRAKCWMEEARELSYDVQDFVDDMIRTRTDTDARTIRARSHRIGLVKIAGLHQRLKRSTRIARFRNLLREARGRHQRYQLHMERKGRGEEEEEKHEGRLEEEQSDDCRHGLSAAAATVETVVTRSQAPGLYGDAAISLVVIDDSRIKLSKMLTIEGDQQLKVVSIVGSAGLGKTSLAKQVYHELGWKFDLRAFVRVSRKPDMRRVLGAILSQVHRHDQPPSGPVQNLIDDIKEHLCNKRYFILVDDLWEKEAWDIVYTAFPNDKNGSRIITTTQDVDVALGCSGYVPKNILMMKPLCIDDSRKLFFSRVFGSEQCPDEIKEVSNNIIRKCGGLLLAITNLAGLLASQVDNFELWYHVWDSLCSSCTVEEIQQEILNLSYSSLPHCLKTCLLYFTMYPEGSIIWKADLVKQWIAEGFINAADGKHKEEVAQCYFDDLVNRGMIQPMQTDDYNSEVLSCTVHHIVLDFITHKSKDAKFISAIDYSQTITGLASLFHRQSLYSSSVKYGSQPARTTMSQLRSLAFFGPLNCIPSIVEFKFLRVLILEFWGNHDGHTSLNLSRIYRLFQLRYLKISGDIKVELPVQMRQLQYLETLEIDARILVVPLDIVSLPSLLHLCLQNATKLPDGIGRIRSLCTLQYFDLSGNSEENIRSLGKLTNLRHLHLTCSTALSDENLKRKLIHLVSSVAKLGNLISLTLDPGAIKTANSIFFYNSRSIFSPLVFLQRLELLPPICFFSTLPNWIGELHKLRILNIMVRELPVHDINILKELPALTALLLYVQTALEGTVVFTSMAFPALRYLKFKCSVMFLTFMEGAIPELRRLELCFNAHRGQNYGRMLDGIEHLLNLQEIAAQIGLPLGADESDKTVGKLSFEGAIRKHPRCPSINIQWVKQIEEEDHPQDLPCKHEIIEKGYMEDTEKDDGRRYLPANANTVMERPSDPFNPPGLAVPAASKAWQMAANNNPWRAPPPPLHNSRTGFGDASLFSTSLPVHPHEKLNSPDSAHGTPSMDDTSAKMKMIADDPEEKDYRFDFDLRQIHDLLPDEDECFSGITNEIEPVGQTNATEELEEFDVFGSGGMELNIYPVDSIAASFANSSIEDGARGNSINPFDVPNTVGTSVGEHPFGEHPSRTLFVRNINSNVEDSELRSLFEQYGEIRTLYTATKHRGFIMISYFDIRSARNAMRALQNKPLRRRKLDIHFSVPKENPSDKDLNQGTLVIFNLDPSVSNEEVRQIFGAYGEVKEIRETPNKKHHKFIEFYDVRAAEAALRSLDKSEIAGKRIKLEPSRPGGTRRNLMQQLGYDLDQEDPRSYRDPHVESPIANSLPGACAHYRSPTDHNMLQVFTRSPTGSGMNATRMPSLISNASKIAPIGKDRNWSKYVQIFSTGNQSLGAAFQHSHSYQDHNSERMSSSPGTLSGPQFVWCSPKPYSEHSQSPIWRPPAIGPALSSNSRSQGQGFLYGSRQASLFGSSDQHHHYVGSAPSDAPFESHFGFLPESPETPFMKQVGFGKMGSVGTNRNEGGLTLSMDNRASMNPVSSPNISLTDNSSTNFRQMLSSRLGQTVYSNPAHQGPDTFGLDSSIDHTRIYRFESSALQDNSKRQYQLDLETIRRGDDNRTTLQIKNIPNKYTSKMLLAAIDELHKGTYDFFYLPIDFKNKCNVGYAFINMISPMHVISFYQEFNGKKWERFNSEKVASLAYARIQGRTALISHFQNSSLMDKDK